MLQVEVDCLPVGKPQSESCFVKVVTALHDKSQSRTKLYFKVVFFASAMQQHRASSAF